MKKQEGASSRHSPAQCAHSYVEQKASIMRSIFQESNDENKYKFGEVHNIKER